jgi:xanthine/uracil permease
MGQTEPHFQTILFTIVMGCLFNRIHFFSNSKGCAHPMLNIFPLIVVGKIVLIMCLSLIKVHPHWKMDMVSPLNPNTITIHGFFDWVF